MVKFRTLRVAGGSGESSGGNGISLPLTLGVLVAVAFLGAAATFAGHQFGRKGAYDDGKAAGYEQGIAHGETKGFNDGKAAGMREADQKRQEGYKTGYSAGQSSGYSEGSDAATQDAIEAIQEYLPKIVQQAYNNGRASAPVYIPSFGFGSIHCTSSTIGSYTSTRCY